MIVFIIPVKSKSVSGNWQLFSQLFDRTLRSACNQTDDNFRVVVVCHETPHITFKHPKVDFIKVDHTPPDPSKIKPGNEVARYDDDKGIKIVKGLEYAKKKSARYVMILDSDDCVRHNLVETVLKGKGDVAGWYMKKGFIYKENSRFLWLNTKNFNSLCGSSIIVKPEFVNNFFHPDTPHYFSHGQEVVDDRTELMPFPGPGVIYSIANRENILMSRKQSVAYNSQYSVFSIDFVKSVFRKISKYRPFLLTPGIRKKYGLSKIKY